ncbi:MucB/RseB C-terminal domain-containing protein [Halomonas sp. SSL-5]|uniref:MucB/RseB C-terminal domain-containing protein n=1 Tax=Halomonas sp. SSL-5 TaxID=3065855 RepID=UPI0027399DEE|nr:MucB/RseB C-terminal domain-containing protein [Halomonas sp. SSL-5]MDY7116546.1 MucB/RseB C-terminal domain-containing protein [Halomonas sp. SSL-5]
MRLLRRCAAGLLPCLLAAVAPAVAFEATPDADRFDCRVLEQEPAPQSALEWYELSLWAGHCYRYDAHAVRIGFDGVRTLVLSHQVDDGVERGQARFLDGPPMAVERRSRIGRLGWSGGSEAPPTPEGIATSIASYYRLSLGGEERIANRRARRLDISPLDSFRYGKRLWLDVDTGLTLKQSLLDETGRVVETFQLTVLERPRLHQGEVSVDAPREAPRDAWSPGWLPAGFRPQPVETRSGRHGSDVIHRLYSDGLSTFSVFVSPLDGIEPLAPGLHRLGVSHAVVRHRELGGVPRQVLVMGEMPPRVLLRVADALSWNAADS